MTPKPVTSAPAKPAPGGTGARPATIGGLPDGVVLECPSCAEEVAPGATICPHCGERPERARTRATGDVDGWDGRILSLRPGGELRTGTCVGCASTGAALSKRTVRYTPPLAYVLCLPLLALGLIGYAIGLTCAQRAATVRVPVCTMCRLRAWGVRSLCALGLVIALFALPLVGASIGHACTADLAVHGCLVGLFLWSGLVATYKVAVDPRIDAVNGVGIDARSVQVTVRCPAAVDAHVARH